MRMVWEAPKVSSRVEMSSHHDISSMLVQPMWSEDLSPAFSFALGSPFSFSCHECSCAHQSRCSRRDKTPTAPLRKVKERLVSNSVS